MWFVNSVEKISEAALYSKTSGQKAERYYDGEVQKEFEAGW